LETNVFINREISWLHFNDRVLQEAKDESNPLLERLRFIGIYSNNRDEFFRVRVATLRRLKELNKTKTVDSEEENPGKTLKKIKKLISEQETGYVHAFELIKNKLKTEGIRFVSHTELSLEQGKEIEDFFIREVHSHLFPIMLNSLKDVEILRDNSIYLLVHLKSNSSELKDNFALVKVPTARLSRFYIFPLGQDHYDILFLDDVIRYNLSKIFSPFGYNSFEAWSIKFTRDAELDIDNDVLRSFTEVMSESLKKRKKGVPVRFIYDSKMPIGILEHLLKKLKLPKDDMLIAGSGYQNFRDFISFPHIGASHLWNVKQHPMSHPNLPINRSIFQVIRHKDVMLHYPYHSFTHIIDFLREASLDPKVKSIKMTLYRAARDSSVVNALVNAARNGKEVTVFLELQARFDEKANIQWAEKLAEEGVQVLKTIPGFKVHCKLISIRRKEDKQDVYYSNIATGNYNESTATVYADQSLLTADQEIGAEVERVFQQLKNPYTPLNYKKITISPFGTRNLFIRLISNEIRNKKAGRDAWMILKFNSMTDERLVKKLIKASQEGVKIKIICRGICVLVPGIKGLTENIEVISIVDKYLEHSRLFEFCNNGKPLFFLSSADWMNRNLDNRYEVVCPVFDPVIQKQIHDVLQIQLSDNSKARLVNHATVNEYKSSTSSENLIRSQISTYDYLKGIL
jgi:polyphosphate kinase